MAREYKNHMEFVQYNARMDAAERRNNTFAERLVAVVEFELREEWFKERETLNKVRELMRWER